MEDMIEYSKLQIGCMLIILYVAFIYYVFYAVWMPWYFLYLSMCWISREESRRAGERER